MKEKIYKKSPHFLQNVMISVFNILAYRKRYSKNYKRFLIHYKNNNNLSLEELKTIQKDKFKALITYAKQNSSFYKNSFKNINEVYDIKHIKKLPIINKEVLRKNINSIYTIPKGEGQISKTGGTTGKSLEVIFTNKDIEERFAILDNFRKGFGYQLGKKTAWFSGKDLLTKSDIKKNRFWKTDFIYNVRYYSTFHISSKYLTYYIKNLIDFKPEFMVGFPSTMYEIAKYGINNNLDFPKNTIKAIFPTAETLTLEIKEALELFFKTNVYDQYASSEGAPFIIECKNHKKHLELQSGIFEVLDDKNQDSKRGRLIITAFNTYGTPLIRYDIGDQIELSDEKCNCGNQNPLVKSILGRVSDYVYSEENGKINLGNISNCLKGVNGVVKFQIEQNTTEKIILKIVSDLTKYSNKDEKLFLENLKSRLGNSIFIEVKYLNDIEPEKSGKYRIVKNNLKKQ